MKTEKRLTMALSVLVALMMLAVPLASSSNLFVDGGQTNSNGDAPSLSAEEAAPGVEILNVWVIDSQASYNKLLQYGFDENNFKGNGADFANNPWIAVVYKISGGVKATDITISNSNMDNELTKTVSHNDDRVHAFTAYLGDAPTFDANGDNLGINVTDDYYGQSFNVSVNATKDNKTYSDSTSLTYAEPSEFSVKDVWIIDNQDSLDKIAKYVGKDVQKTNFGETWGSNDNRPWIAIAYYAPANAGTVDFTLSSDITNMTTPKTITAKVGEKEGIHVFTAYIGSSAVANSNEDAFKLGTINSFEAAKGTYELKVDGTTDVYKVTYSGKPLDVYTYTFNLNIPDSEGRISLDNINVVTTDEAGKIAFSQDPNDKNIVYANIVGEVKIGEIIKAINVTKDGYLFNSWTDENGVQYTLDMQDVVKKSMVLNANWEIQDDWVQVPVDVAYDGNTYKYSTAMPADKGGKTVTINSSSIIKLLPKEIKISGYVINQPDLTDKIADVYTYTVNENNADGKDIKADNSTISITSSVFIEYSLTSYTKITVLCDVFNDEKAVMYAYNSNNYTYQQVWNALKSVNAADLGLKKPFGVKTEASDKAALNVVVSKDGITTTADGKYRVLNWDSGVALDDTKTSPGVDLKLNVELNGYNVIFMVNGQAQIVNIPYNQLTVDKCPFDVTGVNHWVYLSYDNYSKGLINNNTLMPFNFNSQSNIKTVNDVMAVDETPTFVFIACFERADNTAYAVFDASKDANIAGNYGNKYIKSIVIPGKAASGNNSMVIPLPAVQPVYESKNVLIGYIDSEGNPYSNTGEAPSKYGEKNSIAVFNAKVVSYKYTITFYNGSDVNGIFYYGGDSQTSNNSIKTGLVAFSYNGVAYEYKATLVGDALKAFNNILYPAKDGYQITQWKDSDGNVMLDKVTPTYTDGKLTGGEYVVEFKKISSDMSFYANFEAKEYTIVYSGNTATSTNEMKQSVKVDQNVNLFSDSTFSNDGFKLKEWNTRPDGKGTSYALGASFALNGEQFEDLKEGKFTLYAIWEKVGASDNPGDNTDGGNDNTALYLIAGMLAIIAILAIVGILLMRKKN